MVVLYIQFIEFDTMDEGVYDENSFQSSKMNSGNKDEPAERIYVDAGFDIYNPGTELESAKKGWKKPKKPKKVIMLDNPMYGMLMDCSVSQPESTNKSEDYDQPVISLTPTIQVSSTTDNNEMDENFNISKSGSMQHQPTLPQIHEAYELAVDVSADEPIYANQEMFEHDHYDKEYVEADNVSYIKEYSDESFGEDEFSYDEGYLFIRFLQHTSDMLTCCYTC